MDILLEIQEVVSMDRKYIFILPIIFVLLVASGAQLANNHEQIDMLIVNGTKQM